MKNLFAGDSITDPAQLGVSGITYPAWFCGRRLQACKVIAKGGSCASDQALAIYANPLSSGDRGFIRLGTNNLIYRGAGASDLAMYGGSISAYLYFMGGITKNAHDPSITYAGSWGNSASVGKVATAIGSTMTVQFSGDVFALGYLVADGLNGIASVLIDGVPRGNISAAPGAPVTTGYFNQFWSPQLFQASGCGPGTHAAVITLVSGNYFFPDWVWMGPNGAAVRVLAVPRQHGGVADASVIAANSLQAALAASAAATGMDTGFIDDTADLDPTGADMQPDGIHPANQGQFKLGMSLDSLVG